MLARCPASEACPGRRANRRGPSGGSIELRLVLVGLHGTRQLSGSLRTCGVVARCFVFDQPLRITRRAICERSRAFRRIRRSAIGLDRFYFAFSSLPVGSGGMTLNTEVRGDDPKYLAGPPLGGRVVLRCFASDHHLRKSRRAGGEGEQARAIRRIYHWFWPLLTSPGSSLAPR